MPASAKIILPQLTGIRAVAALSVLIAHSLDQAFAPFGAKSIATFTGSLAFFGMSLFFTLSGAVLMLNYPFSTWSDTSFFNRLKLFAIARVARIMPLYIAIGLIFLAATPFFRETRGRHAELLDPHAVLVASVSG